MESLDACGVTGIVWRRVDPAREGEAEHLRQWLRSSARAEILSEMEAFLREPAFEFFFAHQPRASGSATTIMSYRVKKGFEEEFQHWQSRIHEATRAQPGFLGVEIVLGLPALTLAVTLWTGSS